MFLPAHQGSRPPRACSCWLCQRRRSRAPWLLVGVLWGGWVLCSCGCSWVGWVCLCECLGCLVQVGGYEKGW